MMLTCPLDYNKVVKALDSPPDDVSTKAFKEQEKHTSECVLKMQAIDNKCKDIVSQFAQLKVWFLTLILTTRLLQQNHSLIKW